MRFNKILVVFVMFSLAFAGESFSQKVKIVNLEEAISIAKINNSELKIAKMEYTLNFPMKTLFVILCMVISNFLTLYDESKKSRFS